MSITNPSTEIIQRIYDFANLADIVHLAQASKKNYKAFLGRRIPILERGIQNSFGPIPELFKLAISTEPEKKSRRPIGTEIRRNALVDRIIESGSAPRMTLEMMKKMVPYGRVARRWAELYPQLRWRFGYKNRRFLRPHEQERLRRAVYNYWMYCNLFHDDTYMQFDPNEPDPRREDPRLRLLSTLNTADLTQLSEFLEHISQLIETELYPCNSAVCDEGTHFSKLALSKIAWGEGTEYHGLRMCLLKYDPSDLIYLVDYTSTKAQRMDYLLGKGQYFQQARASLPRALSVVATDRMPLSWSVLGIFPSINSTLSCRKNYFQKPEDEDVTFGIADLDNGQDVLEARSVHAWAKDGNSSGKWPPDA